MKFELYTAESDERTVYITGNFNNWNPKDYNFQLTQKDSQNYFIEIDDQLLPDIVDINLQKEAGKM
jgi:hypothetical protein